MALAATIAIPQDHVRLAGPAFGPYSATIDYVITITGGSAGTINVAVDWYDGTTSNLSRSGNGTITGQHTYVHNPYANNYDCGRGDKEVSIVVTQGGGTATAKDYVVIMNDHIGFGEWPDTGSPQPEGDAEEDLVFRGLDLEKRQHNVDGLSNNGPKDFPDSGETSCVTDDVVNGRAWPGTGQNPQPYHKYHRVAMRTLTVCRWQGQPSSHTPSTPMQSANITWLCIVENRTPPAGTIHGESYPKWTVPAQTYYRQMAQRYKAWGYPFYFDHHGEPENDNDAMDAARAAMYGEPARTQNQWAAYWAQSYDIIMRIFREEKVYNCLGHPVRLLGSTYRTHANGGPENWADRLTEHYSFQGCSAYSKDGMDRPFAQCITNLPEFAAARNRGILIGEMGIAKPTGSLPANGQVAWINAMKATLKSWESTSPVEGFCLNSGTPSDGNYSWNSNSNYLGVLRDLAQDQWFLPGFTSGTGSNNKTGTAVVSGGGRPSAVGKQELPDSRTFGPKKLRLRSGGS